MPKNEKFDAETGAMASAATGGHWCQIEHCWKRANSEECSCHEVSPHCGCCDDSLCTCSTKTETPVFDAETDDYGDVMDKLEWDECVKCGFFTPSDGCGYWGTVTHFSYEHDCFSPAPEGATHVHWYNN